MMPPSPGSVPWLMRHELRLVSRTTAKVTWRLIVILVVVLGGLAALGGAPLAAALAHRHLAASPAAVVAVDLMLAALLSLMLSQALSMTVQAFYQRGDLDLLLSSPVPVRRVLLVRCAGIAFSSVALYLVIVTPLLAAVVGRGHWRLLAIYPLLLSLGLAAAGAGLFLALASFATLGPRRTRTLGQVLAAFVGAFIVLAAQVPQFLPHHRAILYQWFSGAIRRGWFAQSSPLAWPLRAAFGSPGPLLALAAVSGLLFLGAVEIGGMRFAALASETAGAHTRRARSRRTRPFHTGLRAVLIRKELRLLARDPLLLSRVLLPVLYLIPAMLISFRADRSAGPMTSMGVVLLTLLAGQIAGNLAWITISGEDAPDLLRCAPVTPSFARRSKLTAAVIPLALLAIPIGLLARQHLAASIAAALGIAASALSNACIQLWYEKPMPRSAFRRRPPGAVLPSLAGVLVAVGWGVAAAIASAGTLIGFGIALAVALVPGVLLVLLWLGRNREARSLYSRPLIGESPARS
jgi:ABC-2 type transport system permease protein